MTRGRWYAVAAGVTALELAMVATDGVTISQATRETFRTDTAAGKVAWAGFWSLLSAWLVPHVWHHAVAAVGAAVEAAAEEFGGDWDVAA